MWRPHSPPTQMLCIHVPNQAQVETNVGSTEQEKKKNRRERGRERDREWEDQSSYNREYSTQQQISWRKKAIKPRAQINYFPEEWMLLVGLCGTVEYARIHTHTIVFERCLNFFFIKPLKPFGVVLPCGVFSLNS